MRLGHRWAVLSALVLLAGCGSGVQRRTAAPPRPGQVPAVPLSAGTNEFTLGYQAYEAGRFQEAIRYLAVAAPQMPGDNRPYHFLGASYARTGQYDTAVAALIRANAIKEDANTYDWLGHSYIEKGDYSEAARCYQKGLAMAPDSTTLYYGLGVASYWMGWIPESMQAIDMTLQKTSDPNVKQAALEVQSWLYGYRGMYPEVYGLMGDKRQIGAVIADRPEGLTLLRVFKGFPADAAGLKTGDVLTSFNGTTLKNVPVTDYIGKLLPATAFGSKVNIRFVRAGREHEAEVVVGVPTNFAALVKTTGGARPVAVPPLLQLGRLTVSPPAVSPGQKFDLEIEYTAAAQPAGADGPAVQLEFSILESDRVLHTEKPVSLGAGSGARQTRVQHLAAARKPGNYTIRVSLRYSGLVREGAVDFTVR